MLTGAHLKSSVAQERVGQTSARRHGRYTSPGTSGRTISIRNPCWSRPLGPDLPVLQRLSLGDRFAIMLVDQVGVAAMPHLHGGLLGLPPRRSRHRRQPVRPFGCKLFGSVDGRAGFSTATAASTQFHLIGVPSTPYDAPVRTSDSAVAFRHRHSLPLRAIECGDMWNDVPETSHNVTVSKVCKKQNFKKPCKYDILGQ